MDWTRHLPQATVITERDLLQSFRRDESHLEGPVPRAVVKPKSPADLRALVNLAKSEGFGLVPRGAGTGKAGGCVPTEGVVVVDMADWPGELRIHPENLALRSPVSRSLKDIKEGALEAGLFYPPDPNSWPQCGFGGSLATNAGGPNACKYGMTRHWVLSLDVLLEDGGIHRFGIDTVKCNAGPNLSQIFVGSEGIFGLIVEASVRIIPKPQEILALLLPVKEWHKLLDLPGILVTAGLLPCAFEFWDPAVLEELRRYGPQEARRLPGEALAILEFDDPGCTEDRFLEQLLDILGPVAEDLQMATDEHQREEVWSLRRLTSTFLKERYPHKVSEDIVVPRARVREFFQGVEARKLPMVNYGHLGDGNLHVNFLSADSMAPEELEAHLDQLFRLCLELGGTLSGEHGIGLAKRSAFLQLADPGHLQALRSLKRALDPMGIFNPGKVITLP